MPLFLKIRNPWYPMRSDLARNKKKKKSDMYNKASAPSFAGWATLFGHVRKKREKRLCPLDGSVESQENSTPPSRKVGVKKKGLEQDVASLTHMRGRTHHVRRAGVAAALVPLHVAAHAESFAATDVRALERLLSGVRVAVDFET